VISAVPNSRGDAVSGWLHPDNAAQSSLAIFQSPKTTRATMTQKRIVSGNPTSTLFTTPSYEA